MIITTSIENVTCGSCGCLFGLEHHFLEARKKNKNDFHCPNGCCISYSEGEADRLRKKLDAEIKLREAAQRDAAMLRESERIRTKQLEKERKEKRRLEKRIAGGACPCCNRSFVKLAAHMKTKHPEYVAETK